jgi:hypothetical protein
VPYWYVGHQDDNAASINKLAGNGRKDYKLISMVFTLWAFRSKCKQNSVSNRAPERNKYSFLFLLIFEICIPWIRRREDCIAG